MTVLPIVSPKRRGKKAAQPAMQIASVADELPAQEEALSKAAELGRIIEAYSDITDKLQRTQGELAAKVERLQAELSEKNRLLERKNRLAALGEMAAGLAHEIRNPLGGIGLYADLLADDVADNPASLALVDRIRQGVRRLDKTVRHVLAFTRDVHARPQPCDLAEIVREAVAMARRRQLEDRGVTLNVEGPETLPVELDPTLIGQTVLNLVLNAAEVGQRVCIRYAASDEPGRQLCLTVSDDGGGIPADVLDMIFNPFFTTKDHGTGLGLSIAHRAVEAHLGSLTARNEAGGAVFEMVI